MCNGWNHPPGCSCGFGGEGHLGGGHFNGGGVGVAESVAPASSTTPGFSYGSYMRDLATELGYPVVFPTLCRYCGAKVYLFADPFGGFAIFDSVGSPWPKHDCWGIPSDAVDYTSLSLKCSPDYRLPVPTDAPVANRLGNSLSGVIVSKTSESKTALGAQYCLYDGTQLVRIWAPPDFEIGRFLTGTVETRSGQPILTNAKDPLSDVPTSDDTPHPPKGRPAAIKACDINEIWELQFVASTIKKHHSLGGTLLDTALDALAGGYPLVASLCLAELLSIVADPISKEAKACCLKVLLLLIEEMQLHSVLAKLENSLSHGTKKALDSQTRERLDSLFRLCELQRRHTSSPHEVRTLHTRWKREARYAKVIESKTGLRLHAMKDKLEHYLKAP